MSKTRRNKYELPVEEFGSAGQRRQRRRHEALFGKHASDLSEYDVEVKMTLPTLEELKESLVNVHEAQSEVNQ